MNNDSKQENKVWYNGSGHELQAQLVQALGNRVVQASASMLLVFIKKQKPIVMSNDSKQENKVWYNGSGHELQARASGGLKEWDTWQLSFRTETAVGII